MTTRPQGMTSPDFERAAQRARLARGLRVVRRRGLVVVLTLIIGAVAALGISRLSKVKYQSVALIVVAGSPGTATGAAYLAATYAGFIPQDEVVQQALANAIGVTDPKQYPSVGRNLVATIVTNSAILNLTFTASSPQEAQRGLHALVSDLTLGVLQWKAKNQPILGCSVHYVASIAQTRPPNTTIKKATEVQYYCPLTPAIPLSPASGYVVMVKDATAGLRSSPGSVKTGVLGGVLGLLLGLVLAVAWERSDPHIDDLDDLRSEVECPSWEGTLTPAAAMSVLAHWRETVPAGQIQISIIAAGRCDPAAVATLQRTMQQAARNQGVGFHHVDLDGKSVLEGLDTQTPIVMLCVGQGTPLAELRDTVRRLRELGHAPDWAFLVRTAGIAARPRPPARPELADRPPVEAEPATSGRVAVQQPR